MPPRTRLLIALVACGALAGCGAFGPTRACTAMAARTGVSVEVEPPVAAKVSTASMRVCWEGVCRTPKLRLHPSTTTTPRSCSADEPSGACRASAVPTGGQSGFGVVKDLPKKRVRVTVVLRGDSGDRVFRDTVAVRPKTVYPNGRRCGGDGPQAAVVADSGRLRPHS